MAPPPLNKYYFLEAVVVLFYIEVWLSKRDSVCLKVKEHLTGSSRENVGNWDVIPAFGILKSGRKPYYIY